MIRLFNNDEDATLGSNQVNARPPIQCKTCVNRKRNDCFRLEREREGGRTGKRKREAGERERERERERQRQRQRQTDRQRQRQTEKKRHGVRERCAKRIRGSQRSRNRRKLTKHSLCLSSQALYEPHPVLPLSREVLVTGTD